MRPPGDFTVSPLRDDDHKRGFNPLETSELESAESEVNSGKSIRSLSSGKSVLTMAGMWTNETTRTAEAVARKPLMMSSSEGDFSR